MRIKTSNDEMRAAFDMLESNAAFQETLKLLAEGASPHDMVRAMAAYPPVLRAMEAMGEGIYPGGSLPRELKELVLLQSSVANACQFCTKSHIDIARGLGMGEEPVTLLENSEQLPPAFRVALDYTSAVRTDSNRISDAQFESLREHYTDSEIVELTFLVGYINMLNWFNNALQVEYRGELSS